MLHICQSSHNRTVPELTIPVPLMLVCCESNHECSTVLWEAVRSGGRRPQSYPTPSHHVSWDTAFTRYKLYWNLALGLLSLESYEKTTLQLISCPVFCYSRWNTVSQRFEFLLEQIFISYLWNFLSFDSHPYLLRMMMTEKYRRDTAAARMLMTMIWRKLVFRNRGQPTGEMLKCQEAGKRQEMPILKFQRNRF